MAYKVHTFCSYVSIRKNCKKKVQSLTYMIYKLNTASNRLLLYNGVVLRRRRRLCFIWPCTSAESALIHIMLASQLMCGVWCYLAPQVFTFPPPPIFHTFSKRINVVLQHIRLLRNKKLKEKGEVNVVTARMPCTTASCFCYWHCLWTGSRLIQPRWFCHWWSLEYIYIWYDGSYQANITTFVIMDSMTMLKPTR